MSELTMASFVKLDGVVQAPGGPGEDERGGLARGERVHPFPDDRGAAGAWKPRAGADAARSRTGRRAQPAHLPDHPGGGKKLFGAGTVPTRLELAATRTTGSGAVIGTYRRTGRSGYGSFALEWAEEALKRACGQE